MPAASTGVQAMALEKQKVALVHGWSFRHVRLFDPQPSLQTEPTAAGAECQLLAPGPDLGPLLKSVDPGTDSGAWTVAFVPEQAYRHV